MSSTEKWSLGTTEYGKACGTGTQSKIKVWMGKVLPLIPFAKPNSKMVPLNKGCIINDSKCRPQISSQVRSVNYITVPVAEGLDGRNIKHGTKVRIDVTNHSVDQLVVTNTETTTSSLQGSWTKTAKNMKLNGYSNSKDFSVAAIQQLYDETKRLESQKRDK